MYKMYRPSLPDVTLLAISSIQIAETIQALKISSQDIDFGAIKLISDEKPKDLPYYISYEYCPKIKDIMDFNNYVFYNLINHVKTNFCLMVQYHAWIIHPEIWTDRWLQYDYIGAPWAIRDDAYICHDTGEHVRVGNGGFSLRSRKIMEIPIKYNLPLLQEQGWYNEDGNLCVYQRKKMLELGVKYAPVNIASRFSYENTVPENQGLRTFGFHRNKPNV